MMLPLAVIVILAAATYRVTRLFTADTITLPAREMVFRWAWTDDRKARDAWAALHPGEPVPSHVPRGWEMRAWVYDLVTCDQCLGVWWAAAIYAAYVLQFDVDTDAVASVISVAAICGGQSVVAWVVDMVAKMSKQLDD